MRAASLWLLLLLAGCGESGTSLFGSPGGGAAGMAGGPTAGSGGARETGGSGTGGSASGTGASGPLGGAGPGGTAGENAGGGGAGGAPVLDSGAAGSATADAAMNDGSTDASSADAAGGGGNGGAPNADAAPPGETLECGTSLTCDVSASQVCCAVYVALSNITTYACLDDGDSTLGCNSSVRACDGASDCPGQECCAQWLALGGRYGNFSCVDQCSSMNATVECRGRGDCGDGELCCGDLTANDTQYAELACETTCNEEIICDTAADCPDGYDCDQSLILPPGWGHCVAN